MSRFTLDKTLISVSKALDDPFIKTVQPSLDDFKKLHGIMEAKKFALYYITDEKFREPPRRAVNGSAIRSSQKPRRCGQERESRSLLRECGTTDPRDSGERRKGAARVRS
jgi:hypothetical protein